MDIRDIGDAFQRQTKYERSSAPRSIPGPVARPYKSYRERLDMVPLEGIPPVEGPGIFGVMQRRRSRRSYAPEEISLGDLSVLAWAAAGVTHSEGDYHFRTAPSAGALYPVETYVAVHRVGRIAEGLYHYAVLEHAFELIQRGDVSRQLAAAALDQDMVAQAAATFIWTAISARSRWKYGERRWRYIYLDAGHIGQNVHLAAEALGLGSCAIGAFLDDEVNAILGADGKEETAVYLMSVGRPSRRA